MNAGLQRLHYLFEQYINNRCTEAERQELMYLVKQSLYETEIKQLIGQEIARGMPGSTNANMLLSAQKADVLFSKIIGNQKKEPVKIRYGWRVAAAAVVLMTIGLFGYFFITKLKTPTVAATIKKSAPVMENDALPGSKRGCTYPLKRGADCFRQCRKW